MTEILDAVLFDLDGTLVRTFIDFPALRRAVQDRVRERYSAEESIVQQADSLDIIAGTIAGLPEDAQSAARRDLYDLLEAHEESGCANPQEIPGATALLEYLSHRNIRIAVVTRNARRIAVEVCARMDIYSDILIAREDTQTYKPHPEPLLLACRKLHVDPSRTAMIGDLWADVAAGTAAGCEVTIGIQWSYDPPDRFARAKPSYIVPTLEKAGEILRGIVS